MFTVSAYFECEHFGVKLFVSKNNALRTNVGVELKLYAFLSLELEGSECELDN
jgi:hypothetical protein